MTSPVARSAAPAAASPRLTLRLIGGSFLGGEGQTVGVQVTGAGTGLVPVQVAMKPKVVVAFGARTPFQPASRTVTAVPVWVAVPPHAWDRVCPAVKVQPMLQ